MIDGVLQLEYEAQVRYKAEYALTTSAKKKDQ
jgi:hypothetical protein